MLINFAISFYALILLLPLFYLAIVSVAGTQYRNDISGSATGHGKLAVLIPAHNEESHIEETIESILVAKNLSNDVHVFLLADNCTDRTVEVSKTSSITILERKNDVETGKGAVLQWALNQLKDEEFDYFAIIDADSLISKNYFKILRHAFENSDYSVFQTRYQAASMEQSNIKHLAILGHNVLRARGRSMLGGSAGIFGNGFAFKRHILDVVPFTVNSIVEDLEYHNLLILAKQNVCFLDEAQVFGRFPIDRKSQDIQEARWEGGKVAMIKKTGLPLLLKAIAGNRSALFGFFDLILLPIGYSFIFLLSGLFFDETRIISITGLCFIVIYSFCAASCGNGIGELKAISTLPKFLLGKIRRIPMIIKFSKNNARWQRTPRDVL